MVRRIQRDLDLAEARLTATKGIDKVVRSSGQLGHMTPKPRWTNENSSQQAAALVYSVILLPIAQSVHAHRTKPTELLNFDVVGSGGL